MTYHQVFSWLWPILWTIKSSTVSSWCGPERFTAYLSRSLTFTQIFEVERLLLMQKGDITQLGCHVNSAKIGWPTDTIPTCVWRSLDIEDSTHFATSTLLAANVPLLRQKWNMRKNGILGDMPRLWWVCLLKLCRFGVFLMILPVRSGLCYCSTPSPQLWIASSQQLWFMHQSSRHVEYSSCKQSSKSHTKLMTTIWNSLNVLHKIH